MQFTIVSGAAVLLALVPTALSTGTAHVVNNCGFDVYYAPVQQNTNPAMQKISANGYSASFSSLGNNNGLSFKVGLATSGPVNQFELTWTPGNIAYDISNINGNPLEPYGSRITPSNLNDAGFPTCVVIDCAAGASTCTAAYNQPDDVRTKVCPDSIDLLIELCTSGGSNSQTRSVTNTQTTVPESSQTTSVQTTTPSAAPSAPPSWPGSGHWHGRQHARHLPKI